jgi:hypothetical protein
MELRVLAAVTFKAIQAQLLHHCVHYSIEFCDGLSATRKKSEVSNEKGEGSHLGASMRDDTKYEKRRERLVLWMAAD